MTSHNASFKLQTLFYLEEAKFTMWNCEKQRLVIFSPATVSIILNHNKSTSHVLVMQPTRSQLANHWINESMFLVIWRQEDVLQWRAIDFALVCSSQSSDVNGPEQNVPYIFVVKAEREKIMNY